MKSLRPDSNPSPGIDVSSSNFEAEVTQCCKFLWNTFWESLQQHQPQWLRKQYQASYNTCWTTWHSPFLNNEDFCVIHWRMEQLISLWTLHCSENALKQTEKDERNKTFSKVEAVLFYFPQKLVLQHSAKADTLLIPEVLHSTDWERRWGACSLSKATSL